MRAGYVRVSANSGNKAAGKIRKVRCECTGDGILLFWHSDGDTHKRTISNYFYDGETGNAKDECPKCTRLRWYTI